MELHSEREQGSKVFRQDLKSPGTCARCHQLFWDVCTRHAGSGAVGPRRVWSSLESDAVRGRDSVKNQSARGGKRCRWRVQLDMAAAPTRLRGEWSWCQKHLTSVSSTGRLCVWEETCVALGTLCSSELLVVLHEALLHPAQCFPTTVLQNASPLFYI